MSSRNIPSMLNYATYFTFFCACRLYILVSGPQLNKQLIAVIFCNGQLLLAAYSVESQILIDSH